MKLVLFSGGVDSTTCLALAKEKDKDVMCISFDYGQRHRKYELEAAQKIAKYYNVDYRIIDIKSIFQNGHSSLTDLNLKVTKGDYNVQNEANTEVEFRNGVFLGILASLAMQYEADEIYYGAHRDDKGAIYHDCTKEFLDAMNKTVNLGTGGKVRINAPFIDSRKADIVAVGKKLKVPYELTYSCYNGTMPPCGKCGTCIDRKKAFLENGIDLD